MIYDWSSQLYTQLKQLWKKNSGLNEIQGILRVYYKLTKWPAPSGLIAQLVEHYTSIAEVMGSNPVQAWVFFFFQAVVCVTAMILNHKS